MKIVENNILPPKGYKILNLFGILFVRKDTTLSPEDLNHENIHTVQMKEMLYIFFYLWYGVEYLIVRFFHKKQNSAYHDVSFEEEAHLNEDNLDYLSDRKHYSWFKFIKIKNDETT